MHAISLRQKGLCLTVVVCLTLPHAQNESLEATIREGEEALSRKQRKLEASQKRQVEAEFRAKHAEEELQRKSSECQGLREKLDTAMQRVEHLTKDMEEVGGVNGLTPPKPIHPSQVSTPANIVSFRSV